MEPIIQFENVSKAYGGVKAVEDLSFSVRKGEIFGIIGPNGAGKTTTLEMLEGVRKPDRGNIHVLGLTPHKQMKELNKHIGVQFQSTSIQKKMKVREALELFSSFYKNPAPKEELIEHFHLNEKLDVTFDDLSGGWQQRVTLALATLPRPKLLFLDEPSMGLDPHARREMWSSIQSLREQGSTIVVSTHYMEEAEKLCDRVAMIYNGQLKALNTPRQLLDGVTAHYLSVGSVQIDREFLTSLPDVVKVEQEDEMFKVFSNDQQKTAYHLFTYCHEQEIVLTDFKFEKGSLDDLFVQYLEKEPQT
ncbi:ABC transporter ATP-binding protein [Halobacillus sp. A5]|uniref:ABC transporter ATP-binding protein n=1 Tax=Halobacillus sp. A5 TaxID=2880263 RepID=UPI0020A66294|nr:ABC transporter ATP-binding protein [Halobacillus sp. A5]MCP3028458.1 ABC transporter ATP-binding protein [Halobacillus sp. A5]